MVHQAPTDCLSARRFPDKEIDDEHHALAGVSPKSNVVESIADRMSRLLGDNR
jgi:hypothetical protein